MTSSSGVSQEGLKACPFCGSSVGMLSKAYKTDCQFVEHHVSDCPANGIHLLDTWNRRAAGVSLPAEPPREVPNLQGRLVIAGQLRMSVQGFDALRAALGDEGAQR